MIAAQFQSAKTLNRTLSLFGVNKRSQFTHTEFLYFVCSSINIKEKQGVCNTNILHKFNALSAQMSPIATQPNLAQAAQRHRSVANFNAAPRLNSLSQKSKQFDPNTTAIRRAA